MSIFADTGSCRYLTVRLSAEVSAPSLGATKDTYGEGDTRAGDGQKPRPGKKGKAKMATNGVLEDGRVHMQGLSPAHNQDPENRN